MALDKSDIPKLLDKAKTFLVAIDQARGSSQALVKAGPLEIEFYNIASRTKHSVESYVALLEDANGTYLQKIRSK